MFLFNKKKKKKLSWHDYTKEVCIEYLERRYPDKKFLPIALYPDYNVIDFRAYPEGGDPKKDMIYVHVRKDLETKEVSIEDNYFFEYIRKEYEECVSNILGQVFDTFKFYCERSVSSMTTDELKTEHTWEYMKQNGLEISIDIVAFTEDELSKEEFEGRFIELTEKLNKAQLSGGLTMYHLKQGCMDNVHADNYDDYNCRYIPEIGSQVLDELHEVTRG